VEVPPQPSRAILAEGATGTFFSTDVAVLNPSVDPAPVTVRYFREGQEEMSEPRTLPGRSRTTIHLDDVAGLEATSVSTQVDSPAGQPLVVERLMSWDARGYGGHLGTAVDAPLRTWYFAEGAQGYFSTFFLIANSGTAEATVDFTFLVELGQTVHHRMKVPRGARRTFYAGDLAGLVNRSFATVVESDLPVVAERAMYFGASPFWFGGHGSAGVGLPAFDWFHAEGATGPLFDTLHPARQPVRFRDEDRPYVRHRRRRHCDAAEDRRGERPADGEHRRRSAGTGQRQRVDTGPLARLSDRLRARDVLGHGRRWLARSPQ
jgi:hypothetical protein